MFALPSKNQILWTVIIALAVMAIVSRVAPVRRIVTGAPAAA